MNGERDVLGSSDGKHRRRVERVVVAERHGGLNAIVRPAPSCLTTQRPTKAPVRRLEAMTPI